MMNKSNWVMTDAGWRHRPWWKVAINSLLRHAQFWTDSKLLLATESEEVIGIDCEPVILGYGFHRITMRKGAK